jgi:hypothetical protein
MMSASTVKREENTLQDRPPRYVALSLKQKSHSARRPHTKSRLGCHVCKKRRVKVWVSPRLKHSQLSELRADLCSITQCDELKPICGGCTRLGLRCDYSSNLNPSPQRDNNVPGPHETSFSIASMTCSLHPLLASAINSRLQFGENPNVGLTNVDFPLFDVSDLQRLHHFYQIECLTVGGTNAWHFYRGKILKLGLDVMPPPSPKCVAKLKGF